MEVLKNEEEEAHVKISVFDADAEKTILEQVIYMRDQSIDEKALELLTSRIDAYIDCMNTTVPVVVALSGGEQQYETIWSDFEMISIKQDLRKMMTELTEFGHEES